MMAIPKDAALGKQLPGSGFEVTAVLLEASMDIIHRTLRKHFGK